MNFSFIPLLHDLDSPGSPLGLDLLGLQVHLDQATLEIDAQTGPGNLLGNLLCAITGSLDGAGTLTAIAQLLNRIIDLIGTLP